MVAEMNLNIEKSANGYTWTLFHEDAIGVYESGEKASIACALRAGFASIPVGEEVNVGLYMSPLSDDEYHYADDPPQKSGGLKMAKSENPDFERGAKALLGKLR